MPRKTAARKPLRFRLVVLIAALFLVSSLYVMLRQDRLETELRDAVMQSGAGAVHAALGAGASAKASVWKPGEPNLLEKLLHGTNPFVNMAAAVPTAIRPKMMLANEHTLLMYVVEAGSVEIMEDLIAHGADVERRLSNGSQVIFLCSGRGGSRCLEGLLRHGARANVVNSDGQSPLHVAAASDSVRTMRILVDHGANPSVKDRAGLTPLAAAAGERACNLRQRPA